MNRSIALVAAVLLAVSPVLASAQTAARPGFTLPRATVQVQRNVLVLPAQEHADVLRDLQTIIDAQPRPGMSVAEVRLMTQMSQWAVAQRNRLRYADQVRSFSRSAAANEIARANEALRTIGDDAQLANIDLQNTLQRQQQTMQMMSNVSRMMHDTAMSVIRKMGG
jgi:hypothetical protein